jgi:hypothetical protein
MMQDLIGWVWQKMECERLGLTVEEHTKLVEASAQTAALTGCSVIDSYQAAVNAGKFDKSANEASHFIEEIEVDAQTNRP